MLNLGLIDNLSNFFSSPDIIVQLTPVKALKSAALPFFINLKIKGCVLILDGGDPASDKVVTLKGNINIEYTMRAKTKIK